MIAPTWRSPKSRLIAFDYADVSPTATPDCAPLLPQSSDPAGDVEGRVPLQSSGGDELPAVEVYVERHWAERVVCDGVCHAAQLLLVPACLPLQR